MNVNRFTLPIILFIITGNEEFTKYDDVSLLPKSLLIQTLKHLIDKYLQSDCGRITTKRTPNSIHCRTRCFGRDKTGNAYYLINSYLFKKTTTNEWYIYHTSKQIDELIESFNRLKPLAKLDDLLERNKKLTPINSMSLLELTPIDDSLNTMKPLLGGTSRTEGGLSKPNDNEECEVDLKKQIDIFRKNIKIDRRAVQEFGVNKRNQLRSNHFLTYSPTRENDFNYKSLEVIKDYIKQFSLLLSQVSEQLKSTMVLPFDTPLDNLDIDKQKIRLVHLKRNEQNEIIEEKVNETVTTKQEDDQYVTDDEINYIIEYCISRIISLPILKISNHQYIVKELVQLIGMFISILPDKYFNGFEGDKQFNSISRNNEDIYNVRTLIISFSTKYYSLSVLALFMDMINYWINYTRDCN